MLLTSTEIISKSWEDYQKNWHNWMFFSLLIFLPSFVLMLSGSFGGFLNTYVPSTSTLTDLIIFILFIFSAFFGLWTSLALTHAGIKFLQSGKNDFWKEHYTATLLSIWPAFYTSFFALVFVALGIIFFLIPGIIISVWYFFIIYNIIANDERGFKALSSSKQLVRGRWWSVAWRITIPALFFGFSLLIIQSILVGIVDSLPFSILSIAIIENVVKGISSSIMAPLTMLAGLNLYYSLRDNPFSETPVLLSNEPPAKS
ncbi:MAG: hypothetical protein WC725_03870 [Patescibacteria group bacterium]|jgi:hypothetical protein